MQPPFPPPSSPPRPSFRWGRGLLHAVLALVAIMIVFGILAVVLPVADPKRFGEGVGRFSLFMGLGALGVSALAQTGRRAAAWVAGVVLAVAVAALVIVLVVITPQRGAESSTRPLPTDELVRADGVLRHPSLGVSIPDPGPSLQPSPALARQMTETVPDSRAWVYGDTDAGDAVIVLLTAGTATNEQSFTAFVEGVASGQTSAMTKAGMTADAREHSIEWGDRRAHLYVVAGGAVHMRIDAFGLPGAETLVIVSAAPTAERFATLAAGVKVP
jgi:hypothetical protein